MKKVNFVITEFWMVEKRSNKSLGPQLQLIAVGWARLGGIVPVEQEMRN